MFTVREKDNWTLVHFDVGVLTPAMLKELCPPEVNCKKGVVLSGRGPIWLYGYLIHHYHPAAWVATYDPRLGSIVVMSHVDTYNIGDVVG